MSGNSVSVTLKVMGKKEALKRFLESMADRGFSLHHRSRIIEDREDGSEGHIFVDAEVP